MAHDSGGAREAGAGHALAGDLAVVGAYLLAVALFAPFLVTGDGTFYYDLTRRLVGDGGVVYAYQWGTSLWNAPFYLAGHALGLPRAVSPPHATGEPFRDVSITVAAGVAALGAVLVSRRVVVRLGLPSSALLLLGALFGTELWFYGIIEPSYTHAVDALAFSAAAYLLVRVWQGAHPAVAAALGAVLVGLVTVRYANVAALPGFLVPLALRRARREIVAALLGAAAAAIVLLAIPLAVRTGFGSTADFSHRGGNGALADSGELSWVDLLIPLRMLVSPERGLLVYAPLCGVALAGFAFAVFSSRRNRMPLTSIGLAALGILLVYAGTGGSWWGGEYSYGQRFLTSFTVVTLIGLAELRRRMPRLTSVAVVLCTAWSLFLGINFAYGWEGVTNTTRNADDIVRLYTSGERTPWEFLRIVGARLHDRFLG